MPDILERIVERRREDYARFGPTFGTEIPASRLRAVRPFLAEPGAILEIKRASPSKGDIAPYLDPVKLARQYTDSGAKNISVLTERPFFKGGLADLVAASSACPEIAFLRKDFLLYEDEIEIAYRSGADAVLLIARILDRPLLLRMAARVRFFGMTPFIEVREADDIPKLKAAAKEGSVLAGVNARDLATFMIDPLVPATLRSSLPCRTVFESGASTQGACRFARRIGFDGILIGEAAVRDPSAAPGFVESFRSSRPDWVGHFWREVGKRTSSRPALKAQPALMAQPALPVAVVNGSTRAGAVAAGDAASYAADGRDSVARLRPLVKICGLTNAEDAIVAADLGADLLGFVFAPSPRAANGSTVREIASLFSGRPRPLLVGVIVDPESPEGKEAIRLVIDGVLDAIQCHGVEDADALCRIEDACGSYGLGRYAAVRLGGEGDLALVEALVKSGEPRILVDARAEGLSGGTGESIPDSLVRRVSDSCALWLAGGLNPRNVRRYVDEFAPELIDASSGLESAPGKKDRILLESFFREIAV